MQAPRYRAADQVVWNDTCNIIKDIRRLEHFRLRVPGLQVLSKKWPDFLEPLGRAEVNGTWEIQLPVLPYQEEFMARLLPSIKNAFEREGFIHTVRMPGERLQVTANFYFLQP